MLMSTFVLFACATADDDGHHHADDDDDDDYHDDDDVGGSLPGWQILTEASKYYAEKREVRFTCLNGYSSFFFCLMHHRRLHFSPGFACGQ